MSSIPVSPNGAAAAPAVAEPPAPVAAVWQDRPAEEPWCPAELRAHLGDGLAWAADAAPDTNDARAVPLGAGWRALAAARRGRVHAHAGQHREDAFAVHSAGPVAIAVASDGAGSARWSRVGAEVTCRETVRVAAAALAAAPDRSPAALGAALSAGVAAACTALRELAGRAGAPPRDFRCTALAVALDAEAGTLAAVQVGDGVVALRAADGSVRLLGESDGGEYSGEVSCFVPDACADARAAAPVTAALDGVADVLVATDGVEDPFYPIPRTGPALFAQLDGGVAAPLDGFQRQSAHGPVLGGGVPGAEAASRLLEWLAFEKRGENDDRTAVLLSRPRA